MSIRKETKVGLLVAVAIVLLIVGYSIISGQKLFTSTSQYYAYYERVDGLNESNPIHLNGYQVGRVERITIADPIKPKMLVKFTVKNDLSLPKGSVAEIYSADLLGTKAIQLKLDRKSQEYHGPGDTLIGSHKLSLSESLSQEISPIKKKTISLANTLDSLIVNITGVLDESARHDLRQSFKNLNKSMENIQGTTKGLDTLMTEEKQRLQRIFRNTESITENLRANNEAITNTFENFSAISDTLSRIEIRKTVQEAQMALQRINEVTRKIDEGEGSIGELVNNKSLYKNLESSSKKLDELVGDLQNNPGRYLQFSVFNFNKKQKKKETKE